jgi:hypothetical protein
MTDETDLGIPMGLDTLASILTDHADERHPSTLVCVQTPDLKCYYVESVAWSAPDHCVTIVTGYQVD